MIVTQKAGNTSFQCKNSVNKDETDPMSQRGIGKWDEAEMLKWFKVFEGTVVLS